MAGRASGGGGLLGADAALGRRAREAQGRSGAPGGLFGIAQGSVFPELRARAAAEIAELGFDGYAIGGVSVGEPGERAGRSSSGRRRSSPRTGRAT